MTTKLSFQPRGRGTTAAGLGGLALASVLLLCGAGNLPVENFTPQGAMQADLNAGGHNVTNAATISATNVAAANLTVSGNSLGSAAFAATNAFLASSAIGTTVQGFNASTTTLGNSVNGTNTLVQTDSNGLLVDSVLRPGAKLVRVSQSRGNDTRTGLSKYSVATPFATLTAAASAAAAGDTIVAEDGVFTDRNILLVSGVNWFFLPAATITITNGANNDMLFKDGGTAATVAIGGFGQTLGLSSTAASTSLFGISITAASQITVYGLNFAIADTNSTGNSTALFCNGGSSSHVTVTGNLIASCGTSGNGYAVNMGSSGGGTVIVNGNAWGLGNGNGIGCYAAASGALTVSQNLMGSLQAIQNSSTSTVSCGSLTDEGQASVLNGHLTLLVPSWTLQQAAPTTGFTQAFVWGSYDTVLELMPTGTLAAGTVTFPTDSTTRVGQRLTIMTTQTITSLAVSVTSGTIYGYTTGTLNPGSISFEKIAANVWVKL